MRLKQNPLALSCICGILGIYWTLPIFGDSLPTQAILIDAQPVQGPAFVSTTGAPVSSNTTSLLITPSVDGLLFTFTCQDHDIHSQPRPHDDTDAWKDDCVEIFIDPGHTHDLFSPWVHVLVTAGGALWDERGPLYGRYTSGAVMGGNLHANVTGLTAQVTVIPDGWKAEVLLPWSACGDRPKPGALWGFNAVREDQPEGTISMAAPTHGALLTPDQWTHLAFTSNVTEASAQIAADHQRLLTRQKEQDSQIAKWRTVIETAVIPPTATWQEIGDSVYGAEPDARGPIGGGTGYLAIVTNGSYTVRTVSELVASLKAAQTGETIFIPGNIELDLTVWVMLEKLILHIPGGVTLASDRGDNGSPGALLYSDEFRTQPLMTIGGPNVRITGLRIQGPDPRSRRQHHERCNGPENLGDKYYYAFPVSDAIRVEYDGLEVDNCELSAWSHAAIYLIKGQGHHIHHNYIHHNQRDGLGYGVALDQAEALIDFNLFNFNRHSIAGTGRPNSGYEASHNVQLEESLSHCFDMHGGEDRKDGTTIASSWINIHHNFFGSRQHAISIRGVPVRGAVITRNWIPYRRPNITPDDNISYSSDAFVRTLGYTRIFDNAFGAGSVYQP
jgi:hypothetical protein